MKTFRNTKKYVYQKNNEMHKTYTIYKSVQVVVYKSEEWDVSGPHDVRMPYTVENSVVETGTKAPSNTHTCHGY